MNRLFIALDLPESVKDAIADRQIGLPSARWVESDSLHLTLRFVGNVPPDTRRELIDCLERLSAPAITLDLGDYGHFERRGRPSALWIAVEAAQPLLDLRRRVEAICRAAGLKPESRRFTPHITLARFAGSPDTEALGRWLAAAGRPRMAPFQVTTVTLFNSRLEPGGPRYEPILEVPLETLPDEDSAEWRDPVR